MNKLADMKNKIKSWYYKNQIDIAIVTLIILIILLGVGLWRLNQVKPQKEQIRLEKL